MRTIFLTATFLILLCQSVTAYNLRAYIDTLTDYRGVGFQADFIMKTIIGGQTAHIAEGEVWFNYLNRDEPKYLWKFEEPTDLEYGCDGSMHWSYNSALDNLEFDKKTIIGSPPFEPTKELVERLHKLEEKFTFSPPIPRTEDPVGNPILRLEVDQPDEEIVEAIIILDKTRLNKNKLFPVFLTSTRYRDGRTVVVEFGNVKDGFYNPIGGYEPPVEPGFEYEQRRSAPW